MSNLRSLIDWVGRRLGSGHGGERYQYVSPPGRGPVSASRAADHWVKTTCGYCSVGCGMRVGVKDGRAVAVEGDPDHPVNRGRLCPKGLSEHQTLAAPGRVLVPRVHGRPAPWYAAVDTVVDGFGFPGGRARTRFGGGHLHRAVGDRGVLRPRQAGARRHGATSL